MLEHPVWNICDLELIDAKHRDIYSSGILPRWTQEPTPCAPLSLSSTNLRTTFALACQISSGLQVLPQQMRALEKRQLNSPTKCTVIVSNGCRLPEHETGIVKPRKLLNSSADLSLGRSKITRREPNHRRANPVDHHLPTWEMCIKTARAWEARDCLVYSKSLACPRMLL